MINDAGKHPVKATLCSVSLSGGEFQMGHSGARAQASEPGIHIPEAVADMDSGSAPQRVEGARKRAFGASRNDEAS